MRVLLLGPHPPPEGGITRNMLAIRDELHRAGHQCSIGAITRSTRLTREVDVYHPRSASQLIRLLRNLDYDVLHLHVGGTVSPRMFALMAVCTALGKGCKVLTLHSGGYALTNAGTARSFSIPGRVFRAFERIICVNSLMVEMFERFGVMPQNLRLISPFFFRKPSDSVEVPASLKQFIVEHEPFLLTVGLLEDTYDLFLQIAAMELVLEKYPHAGLMIVGSGSLEQELRAAISSRPYSDSILLTGDVEHAITLHLIADADVLLRTTKYDGDAISIREALFLGTPVIATDNGMRPDNISLIDSPADVSSLVRKISVVVAEKQEYTAAEPDTGAENIAAVLKVYEELIQR